jgi:xanthomonalisin
VDSTAASPTHTWTAPGSYPVTLEVTDSANPAVTDRQTWQVVVHSNPTAGFTWTGANPPVNWQYQFIDASLPVTGEFACAASDANLTTWGWTFDDTSTGSTEQDPPHDFVHPIAGKPPYSVALTAGDACGCKSTVTHQVCFGPNVVTLRHFGAVSKRAPAAPIAAGVLVVGLALVVGVVRRKARG